MKLVTVKSLITGKISHIGKIEDSRVNAWIQSQLKNNAWGEKACIKEWSRCSQDDIAKRLIRVIPEEKVWIAPEHDLNGNETKPGYFKVKSPKKAELAAEYTYVISDISQDAEIEDILKKRRNEYPSAQDLLVALWEKVMEDRPASADELERKRQSVKRRYPKS